jgi:GTPase SAR1 family protein
MSYLRGTNGYLLVADGTRRDTIDRALLLHEEAKGVAGDVPFYLILNKADLVDEWDVDDATRADLESKGWTIVTSSAKSGENVEETFGGLARRMLGK